MKENKNLAKVFHFDLYGKRESKYDFLNENTISSIQWNELEPNDPNFFLVNKNTDGQEEYEKGFKVDELFGVKAAGIKTHRDSVVIGYNNAETEEQINKFLKNEEFYKIKFDYTKLKKVTYRPFDNRVIYYDTDLIVRHRLREIKHSFKVNYSLLLGRQTKNNKNTHFFITNILSEMKTSESSTGSYHFPLYLYPETSKDGMFENKERVPNLNREIVEQISKDLGLSFSPERPDYSKQTEETNQFYPEDILDYIYAVLHSPTYREKYKEFLKIDFPRVPYPKDLRTFWQLVKLGGEIRQIHLLESAVVENYITQYPIDGDNVVAKTKYDNDKVYINETQYFNNVPQVAWEFYIGGYQPAQKWLKDRKDRKLEFEDILHYQKIIVALSETDRLMKKIDKIEIE